jgi:hypothetical protein
MPLAALLYYFTIAAFSLISGAKIDFDQISWYLQNSILKPLVNLIN